MMDLAGALGAPIPAGIVPGAATAAPGDIQAPGGAGGDAFGAAMAAAAGDDTAVDETTVAAAAQSAFPRVGITAPLPPAADGTSGPSIPSALRARLFRFAEEVPLGATAMPPKIHDEDAVPDLMMVAALTPTPTPTSVALVAQQPAPPARGATAAADVPDANLLGVTEPAEPGPAIPMRMAPDGPSMTDDQTPGDAAPLPAPRTATATGTQPEVPRSIPGLADASSAPVAQEVPRQGASAASVRTAYGRATTPALTAGVNGQPGQAAHAASVAAAAAVAQAAQAEAPESRTVAASTPAATEVAPMPAPAQPAGADTPVQSRRLAPETAPAVTASEVEGSAAAVVPAVQADAQTGLDAGQSPHREAPAPLVIPAGASAPAATTAPMDEAPAPPPARLAAGQGEAVNSQLVQSLRSQVRGGIGEAVIRLKPDFLGEVTITVRVEKGQVEASVKAAEPQVRAWLESQEPAVRQSLSDQGLSLTRLRVEPDGERNNPSGQGQEGGEGQPRPRQPRRQPSGEAPAFDIVV